jgi:hypothetical protein
VLDHAAVDGDTAKVQHLTSLLNIGEENFTGVSRGILGNLTQDPFLLRHGQPERASSPCPKVGASALRMWASET